MKYDQRNRATIAELAPNTQRAALEWYEWCVQQKGMDFLIVDGRRTIAEQRENVARGVSHTMKSYHLVGQALDVIPLINGKGVWDKPSYFKEPLASAIRKAKALGFEWGGDWPGSWDCPHLQFNFKGYGTDRKLDVVTPAVLPKVVALLSEDAANQVVAILGRYWMAAKDKAVRDTIHAQADALRYASGLLKPIKALDKDTANAIIAGVLQPEWKSASEDHNTELCKLIGELADDLRVASGQPKTNA